MTQLWTLPTEEIPEREPRQLRWLVASVVVVLGVTNGAVLAGMSMIQANLGYEIVERKFTLADTVETRPDWIFVGDSTCNQGLSPSRFEEHTGETAINLCMTGNMIVVGDLWVLDRLIENVGAPRRGVVLSHAYDVWRLEGEGLELIAAETSSTLEWRQNRALRPATWHELAQVGVGQFLPIATRPESVHRLLYFTLRPPPEREFDSAGFLLAGSANPDRVARDVQGHLHQDFEGYALSDINRRALIELGERLDVPVFIVPSPMVDTLWQHAEIRERVAQAYDDVGTIAAASSTLQLVANEPFLYEPEQMDNADHLDGATAPIYTDAVVAALREAGAISP